MSALCYRRCITQAGIPVVWYRAVEDVPVEGNCFFLAHEFFDALPVHQFQVCLCFTVISSFNPEVMIVGGVFQSLPRIGLFVTQGAWTV